MKNVFILLVFIISIITVGCNNKNTSYGYFDEDDFYTEVHLKNDSIFICIAAVPRIEAYRYVIQNKKMIVYDDSTKVAEIQIDNSDENNVEIIINDSKYKGYIIEEDSISFYYNANNREELDAFSRKILFREQKIRAMGK